MLNSTTTERYYYYTQWGEWAMGERWMNEWHTSVHGRGLERVFLGVGGSDIIVLTRKSLFVKVWWKSVKRKALKAQWISESGAPMGGGTDHLQLEGNDTISDVGTYARTKERHSLSQLLVIVTIKNPTLKSKIKKEKNRSLIIVTKKEQSYVPAHIHCEWELSCFSSLVMDDCLNTVCYSPHAVA
jgi:hypothetical protein